MEGARPSNTPEASTMWFTFSRPGEGLWDHLGLHAGGCVCMTWVAVFGSKKAVPVQDPNKTIMSYSLAILRGLAVETEAQELFPSMGHLALKGHKSDGTNRWKPKNQLWDSQVCYLCSLEFTTVSWQNSAITFLESPLRFENGQELMLLRSISPSSEDVVNGFAPSLFYVQAECRQVVVYTQKELPIVYTVIVPGQGWWWRRRLLKSLNWQR